MSSICLSSGNYGFGRADGCAPGIEHRFAYLGEQGQVVGAAAVGGDVLYGEGTTPADNDLCTVGENLVGGVPAAFLQPSVQLHPVAVASSTWRVVPDLGIIQISDFSCKLIS